MRTLTLPVLLAVVAVSLCAVPAGAQPIPAPRGHAPMSPTVDVLQRVDRGPHFRSLGFQVSALQADVALSFADPGFQGTVTLTLTATQAGITDVYFYVYDPSSVKAAIFDGVPVVPQAYQGVVVLSGVDLAPGMAHTLTLQVQSALPCDSGDLMGDVCSFSTDTRYFFMLGWVIPIFYDETSYQFPKGTVTVHLPASATGLTAVSDGVLLDQGVDADGPVATFDYQSDMATYAVFFGHYQAFEGQWEDVPVRCVLTQAHAGYGDDCVATASDVLQFHSGRYGKYGHASLQIVDAGPIVAGGYGAPANVILNGQIFDYFDHSFTPVVAHEIGHQWWGSYVSFTGAASIPLTEGLAELSACAYQQDRLGNTHCLAREGATYMAAVPAAHDLPLDAPGVTYDGGDAALVLIYDKSPAVLELVRRAVGDDAFFTALGDLVAAGPASRTADELWQRLATLAGAEVVDDFVRPWFAQAGYPTVMLSLGFDDDAAPVVRATQTNAQPFGVLLPVAYDAEDQALAHELRLARAITSSAPLPDLTALPAGVMVNDGRTSILRQIPSPQGDADHDGWVGGFDLLLLARHYQMLGYDATYRAANPFYSEIADFTDDGVVDGYDLQALEAGFGNVAP